MTTITDTDPMTMMPLQALARPVRAAAIPVAVAVAVVQEQLLVLALALTMPTLTSLAWLLHLRQGKEVVAATATAMREQGQARRRQARHRRAATMTGFEDTRQLFRCTMRWPSVSQLVLGHLWRRITGTGNRALSANI